MPTIVKHTIQPIRKKLRSRSQFDFSRARVLDGGFATELERRGLALAAPLWSAAALREAPDAILAVHRSYLNAGAEILLTASYQVSALGWAALGPARASAEAAWALERSVELAADARRAAGRPEVLIAASLGPYGAALANGAEFHGRYGFNSAGEEHAALAAFHRERIAVLAGTEADLLAFETLPSRAEAAAVAEALQPFPELAAWCSFTCRDREHVAHGEPLRECARRLDRVPQVVALGVNCTAPALIAPLLHELRLETGKPLVAYPNSGENWDAERSCWTGESDPYEFEELAREWMKAGATIVGGCCRTTPEHIRKVKASVREA